MSLEIPKEILEDSVDVPTYNVTVIVNSIHIFIEIVIKYLHIFLIITPSIQVLID